MGRTDVLHDSERIVIATSHVAPLMTVKQAPQAATGLRNCTIYASQVGVLNVVGPAGDKGKALE